jgi:hypothetical protein
MDRVPVVWFTQRLSATAARPSSCSPTRTAPFPERRTRRTPAGRRSCRPRPHDPASAAPLLRNRRGKRWSLVAGTGGIARSHVRRDEPALRTAVRCLRQARIRTAGRRVLPARSSPGHLHLMPALPCCFGSIEAARAHCQDFFGSAVPVMARPDYLAPGPIRSRSKTSASLTAGACSRSWWVM